MRKGANPRFVVTSLPREVAGAQYLYEKLYCARGDMENRIKECQLDLFADRTSTATLRANQLRLHFAAFAYVLMHGLRKGAVRHDPGPLAEGRRPREDHRAQGLGVVLLRLPVSRGVRRHRRSAAGQTGPRSLHIARFPVARHPDRPAPGERFAPPMPRAARNAGFEPHRPSLTAVRTHRTPICYPKPSTTAQPRATTGINRRHRRLVKYTG